MGKDPKVETGVPPMTPIRRRAVSVYDQAALGVYRGPARLYDEPRMTAYRRRVLAAIGRKEVFLGKGQHAQGFRWNDGGAKTTVTRTVNEFIRCGWAHTVGAHVELTDKGWTALGGGGAGDAVGSN